MKKIQFPLLASLSLLFIVFSLQANEVLLEKDFSSLPAGEFIPKDNGFGCIKAQCSAETKLTGQGLQITILSQQKPGGYVELYCSYPCAPGDKLIVEAEGSGIGGQKADGKLMTQFFPDKKPVHGNRSHFFGRSNAASPKFKVLRSELECSEKGRMAFKLIAAGLPGDSLLIRKLKITKIAYAGGFSTEIPAAAAPGSEVRFTIIRKQTTGNGSGEIDFNGKYGLKNIPFSFKKDATRHDIKFILPAKAVPGETFKFQIRSDANVTDAEIKVSQAEKPAVEISAAEFALKSSPVKTVRGLADPVLSGMEKMPAETIIGNHTPTLPEKNRGMVFFRRFDHVVPESRPDDDEILTGINVSAVPGQMEFDSLCIQALQESKVSLAWHCAELADAVKISQVRLRTLRPKEIGQWGGLKPQYYQIRGDWLEQAGEYTIPAGETRQFLIEFQIPEECPAGRYIGMISVASANGNSFIPVEINVLPFQLRSPENKNWSAYFSLAHRPDSCREGWWNEVDLRMGDAKQLGLTALVLDPTFLSRFIIKGKPWDLKPLGLDTLSSLLKKHGFDKSKNVYLLEWLYVSLLSYSMPDGKARNRENADSFDKVCEDFLTQFNREVVEAFKKAGLHENIYFHAIDEPTSHAALRPASEAMYRYMKAAGMNTYQTSHGDYARVMWPMLDVSCYAGYSSENELPELRENGIEYWVYGGAGREFSESRAISGWNYFMSQAETLVLFSYDVERGPSAFNDFDGNEPDFCLAYPEPKNPDKNPMERFDWYVDGTGRLMRTLCWAGIRSGIDDVRYAATLRWYAEKAAASSNPELAVAGKAALATCKWLADNNGALNVSRSTQPHALRYRLRCFKAARKIMQQEIMKLIELEKGTSAPISVEITSLPPAVELSVYDQNRIPFTEKAPVIDGKLDDAVWQKALLCGDFSTIDVNRKASPQTRARLLCDEKYLYVAMECFDPDPSKIKAVCRTEGDPKIWNDDSCEIFTDGGATGKSYRHFLLNPLETIYCEDNEVRNQLNPWKCPGYSYRSVTTSKGWQVEAILPLSVLERGTAHNRTWGINLSRNFHRTQEYSCLARLRNGFHDPENFIPFHLDSREIRLKKLDYKNGLATADFDVPLPEGSKIRFFWGNNSVTSEQKSVGKSTHAASSLTAPQNGWQRLTAEISAPVFAAPIFFTAKIFFHAPLELEIPVPTVQAGDALELQIIARPENGKKELQIEIPGEQLCRLQAENGKKIKILCRPKNKGQQTISVTMDGITRKKQIIVY